MNPDSRNIHGATGGSAALDPPYDMPPIRPVGWVKERSDGPTGTTPPKSRFSQHPFWWIRCA